MPEEENVIAQGERSIALGDQATDNTIYSGDDLSIKIERDVLSSAIILEMAIKSLSINSNPLSVKFNSRKLLA